MRVKLHFGTGDGVYEGSDDFEEGVDEEGEVDDDGLAEMFWVVSLEDVEDLGDQGKDGKSRGVVVRYKMRGLRIG